MTPITPSSIRYIKLGTGGAWEAASLDHGRIEWGNADDPHVQALAGDWAGAAEHYRAQGRQPATVTKYVNDLRAFYETGPDALWVSFGRGYLWWAFAEPEVIVRGTETPTQGAAYRATRGPWRNTDITGRPLVAEELSSSLTRVASYRQTICAIAASDYLLRLINAEPDPALAAAMEARTALERSLLPLIRDLHQDDFELFVELLMTRLGWRRVSRLGGTMKDIDMLMELPATGSLAAVQVKSSASQKVLDQCAEAYLVGAPGDAFYFVTHSPSGRLSTSSDAVRIWDGGDLASKAVAAGMTDWLLARG